MQNDSFIKLINKYKWDSVLLRTLFVAFVFIFVPIILTGSIIYSYNLKISREQIYSFAKDSHNQIQSVWEEINSSIYDIHMVTTSQTLMNAFLYSEEYENIPEQNQSLIAISEILKNSINTSKYISSIYIYNQKSEYIISTTGGCYKSMFWDTDWIRSIPLVNYYGFIRDINVSGKQTKYITIIKPFFGSDSCYAIYNIDYYELLKGFSQVNTSTSYIYITSPENLVIFSKDSSELGKPADTIETAVTAGDKYIDLNSDDEYGYSIKTMSLNKANVTYKSFGVVIFLLMILLLVSCLFASFYITSKFYRSIREIIMTIPQDIVPFNAKSDEHNELKFINSAISSLVVKNSKFEQELAQQLTKIKNAQLIALQEQINPHFIFNTLNIISLLDLQNKNSNHSINKVVILLSDILRHILNTDKYLVPLREELEYLKKYIELQSIRYDGKFKTKWDIAPETENLYVVKFSLQPIVENAIIHGFIKKNNSNEIAVKSTLCNDIMQISIKNTGAAIEPSKLVEIQKRLKEEDTILQEHIGLFNTNMRYKLLFGQPYSCTITSDGISGTIVTLSIPKTNNLS